MNGGTGGTRVVLLAAVGMLVFGALRFWSARPPRSSVDFIRLLNGPRDQQAAFFQGTSPDVLPYILGPIREFQSRGQPPWRLLAWPKGGIDPPKIEIEDSAKHETSVTIFGDQDKIGSVQIWPYINGKALSVMADSAMEVTGTPGLAIGYWKDGKSEIEVRGVRVASKNEKILPTDRWPLKLNAMMIELAVARLVETGKMRWDDRLAKRLTSYKLPSWAFDVSVQELVTVNNRRGFIDSAHELDKFPARDAMRRYLLRAFKDTNETRMEGPRLAESPTNTVLAALIEDVTGKKAEEAFADLVFKPLGLETAGYAPTDVSPRTKVNAYSRDVPFLGDGRPLSMSVADLLTFCKLELDQTQGRSRFLGAVNFAMLHTISDGMTVDLEWLKGTSPKGTNWWLSAQTSLTTVWLGVFPEQNAVVVVAMNTPDDFRLAKVGPTFWRIAERICGWPRG